MDLLENPKLPGMLRRLNTKDFKKFNTFMWNGSHISAVLRFLQRSSSIYDGSIHLMERLEASRNTSRYPRMVLSFTEKLGELFRVPKVEELSSNYRTNELLASFFDFLLDIVQEIVMSSHLELVDPVVDKINSLKTELKFLITILGDAPFRCTQIVETKNFLKQLEELAEEAGRFLYLFFFTDEGMRSRMDLSLVKLLNKFEQMEIKIRQHCLTVSKLTNLKVPNTAVDSLFIVSSLVNDIKDLLNRNDDVWDGMETLQEELVLSRSSFEVFKEPHHELMQLRDAAYEAEYLISSLVVGNVPSWYLSLRLPDVVQKIKIVRIGLQEMKKDYNEAKYLVRSFMVGDIPVWYLKPRLPSPDLVEESREPVASQAIDDDIVVGFEDEAQIITDQLVGGRRQLRAVSIFGMPGLGKTTLAKQMYQSCYNRFDRCAWGVASETYQKRGLFIDILKSISELDQDRIVSMNVDVLGEEIYRTLKGRRYLIVLDDVWNAIVWDDLKRYLPDDATRSRIIVTSRVKDVAPPDSMIHELPFLTDAQSWDLLKRKVFQKQDCPRELVQVAKRIATQCQGLPLTVVVIAAVLANMEHRKSLWDEVAGRLISSQISKHQHKCINILELSYKHLPAHLKPCFLYFGAFPEDREISTHKLISLWIAEGFIREEEGKSLRDVAEEYLAELINRSLVLIAKRQSRQGRIKACSMHDLLRELCLRKAKEENFLTLVKDQLSVYEESHRLCIPPESVDAESGAFGLHIRSWLGCRPDISFLNSRMKLVRVLDLSDATHDMDLTGIEQLVLLRYLAVRASEGRLPSSLGDLQNLEFLFFDTPVSVEIPEMLLNLVKLTHLHITNHATFSDSCHTPALVEEGTALECFSNLWIIHEDHERILRYSAPRLRRLKCATRPLWDSSERCHRYVVLDYLTQLQSLNISYLGSEFKFSDTISFPTSLRKLTLHEFKLSWKELSVIGKLPKLEVLKLLYPVLEGKEWKTNDNEFEELRFLKLEALKIHRWNTSRDHFPKLQRLLLHKCWKLKKFPSSLADISTLQVIDIHSCTKSVADSALDSHQQQLEMGNEELTVIISGSCW